MESISIAPITGMHVYNWLQDTAIQKLVVDIRPPEEFEKGYLRTAINVPVVGEYDVDLLGMDKSLTTKNRAFRLRGVVFSHIIIYDGSGTSSALVRMFKTLEREKKFKVLHTLAGGYNDFVVNYPFLCSSVSKKALGGAYPSEIEHNFLYLGSHENAISKQQLKDLGITCILNMASELENAYPDDFKYFSCKLDDLSSEDLKIHLQEALKFIDEAKASHSKVLVHCAMGISRSSAVVIAYVMRERGLTFEQAKAFVKAKRSCIQPNPGFSKQLLDYEKSVIVCSSQNNKQESD